LQVLDDGRLTDGRGRLAPDKKKFLEHVVIMTTHRSVAILESDPNCSKKKEGGGPQTARMPARVLL